MQWLRNGRKPRDFFQMNQDSVLTPTRAVRQTEVARAIPSEVFMEEATRLVNAASERGFVMRALGGVGIRLQCRDQVGLAQRLQRVAEGAPDGQEFVDLDFAAYRRQRPALPRFFSELGYDKRRTTLATAISERHIYFQRAGWFQVDVFFDKMVMEHDLELRGRLEIHPLTLCPTDLLLSKLLITHFTLKDLKDTWLLLCTHTLGRDAPHAIDLSYIARVTCRDWGFWYDVKTNLTRLKSYTPESPLLLESEKREVLAEVDAIAQAIEQQPKSLTWRARGMIGRRKQWYRPVEE